ncbi:MAG: arginyl-tRNA synthetase, partial [Thermoleophilaceae bacterium]|nr:arginyl-tRNA synthetase [Thermoleophilaceae bacterium]
MTPEQLSDSIVAALTSLSEGGRITLPDGVPGKVTVERPRSKEHGDYATNVALQLGKRAGFGNPREFAQLLADELAAADGVEKVDIAGPGFLNITVAAGAQGQVAADVVAAGAAYGTSDAFAGEKVNLEFVSANPTGPLHIGGVRWAAVGDALGRIFTATGAQVTREYYFNDHGGQIDRFSSSLLASAQGRPVPEEGYGGAYIDEIAQAVLAKHPDALDLPEDEAREVFRAEGVELMFAEIRQSLHDFGVDFDVYFHEDNLHTSG